MSYANTLLHHSPAGMEAERKQDETQKREARAARAAARMERLRQMSERREAKLMARQRRQARSHGVHGMPRSYGWAIYGLVMLVDDVDVDVDDAADGLGLAIAVDPTKEALRRKRLAYARVKHGPG